MSLFLTGLSLSSLATSYSHGYVDLQTSILRRLLSSIRISQPRPDAGLAQGGKAGRQAAHLPQAAVWTVLVVQGQIIFSAATMRHHGTHAETHHKYITCHAASHRMTNAPLACIGISLKKSSIWPIEFILAVHAWWWEGKVLTVSEILYVKRDLMKLSKLTVIFFLLFMEQEVKNVDLIGVAGSVLIKDIFAMSSHSHTRRHFSLCFFSLPLHMK